MSSPIPGSETPARVQPSPAARNAAINTTGFFIRIVITFIMAPTMLRHLGDERYGAWLAINDLTGYYGLLDIGVRGAVSYFVARLQSKGQWDELGHMVRSCFWLLSALGSALIVVCVPICLVLPRFLKFGSIPPTETVPASIIITLMVGMNLPFSVAGAILNGVRRIDLASGIEVAVRTTATVVTYYAVIRGCGLVTLASINISASAIVWMLTWAQVRAVGAGTSLWPPRLDRTRIKDVFRFGSASFFLNVSVQVITNIQTIMIAGMLGVAFIATFNLSNQLINYYHQLLGTIALTFTTTFTHLHSGTDEKELKRFFCDSSRYTTALAALGAVGLGVYGSTFLRLWLDERFVTGDPYFRADYVLLVLLVGTIPRTFQSAGLQFLLGARKMRFLTTMRGVEAAANLILSLLLIRRFGLLGVAIGVMVPMFISHAGFMLPYTLRNIGMSWGDYLRRILLGPVVLGVAALVTALLVSRWIPPVSWRTLAANAALVVLVSAPVFLTMIASAADTKSAIARLRSLIRV